MGEKWFTPFMSQCFVTAGISLNLASHGFIMGYTAVLLPQLRRPDSIIPINETSESWIASIPSIFQVLGSFLVPTIMNLLGRRRANLISILIVMICWLIISTADNFITIIICRSFQGISLGMSNSIGPILIGEYTSPKNRGAFITTLSVAMAFGVLIIHTLGSYMSWQKAALIISVIGFVDLIIVIYSPESPTWLADKEKYSECRKVFLWLRGSKEEEELKKMIDAAIIIKNIKASTIIPETTGGRIKKSFGNLSVALTKKEFYKPIFIMVNVYMMGVCSAVALLTVYVVDLIHNVIGTEVNVPLIAISVGIQRIISNLLAVYLYKKFKRKSLMYLTCGLNVVILLATAAYIYAKNNNVLPFDHPLIGIGLMHLHMFSGATGAVPFPYIIAGEIFPVQYKSLAGGISVVIFSAAFFAMIKTVPFMLLNFGYSGTYLFYACFLTYFLVMSGIFLPETKDRTLQDIENEFRGKPLSAEEFKSVQSLSEWKSQHQPDRRCSVPLI